MGMKRPYRFCKEELEHIGGVEVSRDKTGVQFRFKDGKRVFVRFSITELAASHLVRDTRKLQGLKQTRNSAPVLRPPVLDLNRLGASKHAAERLALMKSQAGVTWEELVHTLRIPESINYSHEHGSWVWVGTRVSLAVAVENGIATILTVLWSNNDLWESNPRPERRRTS
jgi:hypothetical protein